MGIVKKIPKSQLPRRSTSAVDSFTDRLVSLARSLKPTEAIDIQRDNGSTSNVTYWNLTLRARGIDAKVVCRGKRLYLVSTTEDA